MSWRDERRARHLADAAGSSGRQRSALDRLDGMLLSTKEDLHPPFTARFGNTKTAWYFPPSRFAKKAPTSNTPEPKKAPEPEKAQRSISFVDPPEVWTALCEARLSRKLTRLKTQSRDAPDNEQPKTVRSPQHFDWSGTPADEEVWPALYKELWHPAPGEDTSWPPKDKGFDANDPGQKYEVLLDNHPLADGPFNWHQNALQQCFVGNWAQAVELFTKIELYATEGNTRKHPVDRARVNFNLGVLHPLTDAVDKLSVAVGAFHSAAIYPLGIPGGAWQDDPVLADARRWKEKAMDTHEARCDETEAAAKKMTREANAFATAGEWDKAAVAWGRVIEAWRHAGSVLDADTLENEALLEKHKTWKHIKAALDDARGQEKAASERSRASNVSSGIKGE